MSNLKTYLAEKYMSGPKADVILSRTGPLKKKKRKAQEVTANPPGGTMIRDEDAGWGEIAQDDDNDDLKDAVVANDRGFKKRKVADASTESSWITVQEGVVREETTPPPPADEQPILVDAPFAGGLVNAQQLKKILPQNNLTNNTNDLTPEEIALAQETVYRDLSGKKIDTKAARAEAARLKRLREEKEAQKMEWGKGLVQKDEAEKRRQELEKQRGTAFARHADDKILNEELKAKELWNDPAAAFLTKNISKGPREPEYKGPPPAPNRFGIKPAYRWDGVDRRNGFEKKLIQSQNSRKRKGAESYQWSVDDIQLFVRNRLVTLAMPAGYVSLPNPKSNPEREMADAFDLDEDVNDNHYEATPLTHNRDQTSATGIGFRRETTSIPGAYDFEREYDFPPPGSPPRPSSRALPNDFGNSNGLLPVAPVQIPKPRVSLFRRAVGAILPTHYTRVPTTEVHSTRLTGGGIENDGVFANVTAKPQPSRVIHAEDGGIYVVPENTEDQTPPSYIEAQADAVPPYWETTIHAPAGLEPGADMIIDDLPTGSFLIFSLNLFISFFFQFVGFLLTYLLHTSHAARYGSRAGLGLTLIQYGFYSRTMPINAIVEESNGYSSERSEPVQDGTQITTPTQNGLSVASKDWLSFLFMTLGWFLLLSSIIGFWRVKRWEHSVRTPAAPPAAPPTTEQVEEDQQLRQNLQRIFGISFVQSDRSRAQQEEDPTDPLDLEDPAGRPRHFANARVLEAGEIS